MNRNLAIVARLSVLLCIGMSRAEATTTIAVSPTNLTGGDVSDLHIKVPPPATITNIAPNPVPPFTITSGLPGTEITLEGGTLLATKSIAATVTLDKDKADNLEYAWTVAGTVVGRSINARFVVPVGVSPVDGHIYCDHHVTAVKLVEPAGWSAQFVPGTGVVDLTGPAVTPGTSFKVEIYIGGDNYITVQRIEWTNAAHERIGKSVPMYCFNNTGSPKTKLTANSSEVIASIDPNPPLPFTTVTGLGTSTVVLSGATVGAEGVGDSTGVIQFNSGPGATSDFTVALTWSDTIPTMSEWGAIIFSSLLLVGGAVMIYRRRRQHAY